MFNHVNQYIDFSIKINNYISTIMSDNKISCEEYSYSHIWDLVKSQGVAIRGFNFEKIASERISGILFQDNLETTITFNQQLDDKDKNFTISHEIIHYLFHKSEQQVIFIDTQKNVRDFYHTDLHEFQANIGASVILIPDQVLIHCLEKGWSVTKLSDHFGISEHQLYERFIQMMQANIGLPFVGIKDLVFETKYMN